MDERSTQGPRNEALAANMRRLMAGKGVGAIRQAMAKRGIKIGQETLHRALRGKVGNRLESLEKIALFFDTTVDQLLQYDGAEEAFWPFSYDLQAEVRKLDETALYFMEAAMWSHLRLPMPAHLTSEASKDPDESLTATPAPKTVQPAMYSARPKGRKTG